ncbi:sporulation related [Candidatus Vecturithrix granuli]|uniref:Sporulation related n=1 Tax=Vecturithrix granuli TaxID=1499967 RepID=A0A081BVB6_VECG1|nr:sporulation related [Candidatus Vecturithrix granuli]
MKNFYKVRGKREFLFDDKELCALGGLTLLIFGLIFALGVMVGQGWQKESVASPLVSHSDFSAEQFSGADQSEMGDTTGESSGSGPVASNSSGENTLQRSYYQVLPDSETYIEVEATPGKRTEPATALTEQSQQTQESQIETGSAQPAKEETPIPPAQVPAVSPPAQQTHIAAPSLPNVPKDPSEDIRIGRQPTIFGNAEPIPGGIIYSVQVASSPNREDSERLVQKYGEAGFQAYVMTADLGEKGIWFRVRVGNMPTRESAEQLKQEILQKAPGLANSPYVIKIE